MAKDAYYFNHDANTRSDPKIIRLRRELGREGSDVFFDLICLLREQAGHRLTIASIPDIAYDFRYPAAKLTRIVNDFDLFSISGDFFHSDRLNRDMEKWETKKQSYRDRGSAGGKAKAQHNFSSAKAEVEQSQSTALAINKVNKVNKVDKSSIAAGPPQKLPGEDLNPLSVDYVAMQLMYYRNDLGKAQAIIEAKIILEKESKPGPSYIGTWAKNLKISPEEPITGRKVIVEWMEGGEEAWSEEKYKQYCNNPSASGYTFRRYE